jgi:hypothetical protein
MLKEQIDLKSTNQQETFFTLSRLFRRYLCAKYEDLSLDMSTDELLAGLTSLEADPELIHQSREIFKKSDIVKFSGEAASQPELEEVYTRVESLLESTLKEERESITHQIKDRAEK